jgi:hypothetical protein
MRPSAADRGGPKQDTSECVCASYPSPVALDRPAGQGQRFHLRDRSGLVSQSCYDHLHYMCALGKGRVHGGYIYFVTK